MQAHAVSSPHKVARVLCVFAEGDWRELLTGSELRPGERPAHKVVAPLGIVPAGAPGLNLMSLSDAPTALTKGVQYG